MDVNWTAVKQRTEFDILVALIVPSIPIVWLIFKVAELFGHNDPSGDGDLVIGMLLSLLIGAAIWVFAIYEFVEHVRLV